MAFCEALEVASALDEADTIRRLLAVVDDLRPGETAPFVRAQRARFSAQVAEHDASIAFASAEELLEALEMPVYLAVTQLEHAEWLIREGRGDEAETLLADPRSVFERLGATPMLQRLDTAAGAAPSPQTA